MKLHLGCGPRYIPGLVHIDVQRAGHVDIVGSVAHLPLRDASASLVYACHVLEHFDRREYRNVLAEWFRVIEPEGILRLAVPDFAACAALYYERGLENGLSGLVGLIVGGQRHEYDFHKTIFDEEFLCRDLLQIGFRQARRSDWRETEHARIDDYSQAYLPHLHKDTGKLMSLNVEAVRPNELRGRAACAVPRGRLCPSRVAREGTGQIS